MKADLFIIDARHLLYRTSDAYRSLTAEIDGDVIATGGMYGFLNIVLKVHHIYGGTVVVAWEGDKRNFRLGLYPKYKRKHEPIDPEKKEFISEMAIQETFLKACLRVMGVRQYLGVNCEADDVIGRLATEVSARGKRVMIYSGDSDLRQLVRKDRVWTVSPGGKKGDTVYGPDEVQERHGVPPEKLAELKALGGDPSDNIPGVRGIGPKTAAELLRCYGSLGLVSSAAALDDSEWPVAERFKDMINQCEDLEMFLKLTTIKTDCDMEVICPAKRQADVLQLLHTFKFRSLAGPAELHGLMKMGG